MRVLINLHKDRTKQGTISIINGQSTRLTAPCLGKSDNLMAAAHGNPSRNPARPFGDTPTGAYHAVWTPWTPSGDPDKDGEHESGYGPLGFFVLVPEFYVDRSGLLIHGGDPGHQYGGLRPTYGCVRVSNGTLVLITQLLVDVKARETWDCVINES